MTGMTGALLGGLLGLLVVPRLRSLGRAPRRARRGVAALSLTAVMTGVLATGPIGAQQDNPIVRQATDEYMVYQLSYVQSDRVTGLLKTLGYAVVEYSGAGAPTVFDRSFNGVLSSPGAAGLPVEDGTAHIPRPIIVQLVDSEKTSLVSSSAGAIGTSGGVVNLGGSYLDEITTAVPQQRLLIVWDRNDPESLEGLLSLVHDQVDVPAKQVLIEAQVIELDQDKIKNLGISFDGSQDGNTASFTSGSEIGGFSTPFTYQFTRPSAQSILNFTASISALVTNGEATVLSRPSVLVLDGRQARIQIGDRVPYTEVTSASLDVGNQIISSTQYQEVGIVLNLRPRVADDDSQITMQVETLISSAGAAPESPAGVLIGPPIQSREVQTLVRIANDTPFVIGGLISSTDSSQRSGLPLLSRIPGLGRLFETRNKTRVRKEVIVVITPHVIREDDRSFSYSVPRDSDLFDQFDLKLFRNVYRVRSDDVFDLEFIRGSDFFNELRPKVVARARALDQRYSPALELPPIAAEDRNALVERVQAIERVRPGVAPAPFVTMLGGGIPGEEILVRRMLLELIENQGFGRFVDLDKILFFEQQFFDGKADGVCPAPSSPVEAESAAQLVSGGGSLLAGNDLSDFLGPVRGRSCNTLVLCFETTETSGYVTFDPPTALVSYETVPNEHFERRLKSLNQRGPQGGEWGVLSVLLNNCYERGEGGRKGSTQLLRDVLVLKRLLDLNPTLPLTIDAFHVGREIVFPTEADLRSRTHLIDRRTAQLFFETLDYYGAFVTVFNEAHDAIKRAIAPRMEPADAAGAEDQAADPVSPVSPVDSMPPAEAAEPETSPTPTPAPGPDQVGDLGALDALPMPGIAVEGITASFGDHRLTTYDFGKCRPLGPPI